MVQGMGRWVRYNHSILQPPDLDTPASHSQLLAQKAMLDELREILRDYASDKERLLQANKEYQHTIAQLQSYIFILEDRLAGPIYDLSLIHI